MARSTGFKLFVNCLRTAIRKLTDQTVTHLMKWERTCDGKFPVSLKN